MLRLESWIIKIARPMTHTLSDIIMWVSQLHSHSSFPVVELYQELNRLTWLRCAKPSSQSLLTWRFLNDSLLPPAIYLQPGDGSLVFIGSSHTVGRYHCVSVEQGLGKTVAIFSVKQGVTPHGIGSTSGQRYITSQSGTPTETGVSVTPGLSPSTSHTTSHSSTCQGYVITTQIENLALNSSKAQITDDGNPLKPVKSYHGELVAVSVLLAACVLTLGGLYLWHQRSLRRVQLGLGPEKTLSLGTVDPWGSGGYGLLVQLEWHRNERVCFI